MALKDLSLKELRKQYPGIKANSKKKFLAKIEELDDVILQPLEEGEDEVSPFDNELLDFLYENAKSRKKILVDFPTSMDADDAFAIVQFELFPLLNEDDVLVKADSRRRDFHMNGTCYCRLVCQTNYDHIRGMMKYDTFKTVSYENGTEDKTVLP